MKEIRIYAEGGGPSEETKAGIRRGLGKFLEPLRRLARHRRLGWKIIACGGRGEAFDIFRRALKTHPQAFNVLLVDAEAPVTTTPWRHLEIHDGWKPPGVGDEQCHLMVQVMEAWFVADLDMLARFYGTGFRRNVIPKNDDVEQIDKVRLESSLQRATADSKKGRYHKIRHGGPLLGLVRSSVVRQRARHCDRLFEILEEMLRG